MFILFVQNNTTVDEWMLRKLSRIMTERAKSQSIASSKVYFSTFINFHSLVVLLFKIINQSKPEYYLNRSQFTYVSDLIHQRRRQIFTIITRLLDTT